MGEDESGKVVSASDEWGAPGKDGVLGLIALLSDEEGRLKGRGVEKRCTVERGEGAG